MPSPPSRWQGRDRLRGPGSIAEPSKIFGRAPHGRAASAWSQIVDGIHFQRRVEWSAPEATAESRIVTTANSGSLANARRRSRGIRSALRAGTSVKRSSPPLPVTSELIEVGAPSFLTPRLDPCTPRVFLTPRHGARYVLQSCAVVHQVAPSSTLMRGRKS
jgi:hypothetical protein